jgi:hypothetical protein
MRAAAPSTMSSGSARPVAAIAAWKDLRLQKTPVRRSVLDEERTLSVTL